MIKPQERAAIRARIAELRAAVQFPPQFSTPATRSLASTAEMLSGLLVEIDSGNEAFRIAREQWRAEIARLTEELRVQTVLNERLSKVNQDLSGMLERGEKFASGETLDRLRVEVARLGGLVREKEEMIASLTAERDGMGG